MAARNGGAGSSRSDNSRIRNEVVSMYKSFVSEVNPRDVLDLLIEKRVIGIEGKDEIMSKTTKQDRCRALLDQLFSCSHDEAFVVLRQALEESYHWIVERIDKSKSAGDECISSGGSNDDNVLDMVRRLEHSEKWTEVESRQVLIKQNRLAIKEDQLKQDLEASKKDLQLTKKHELELIQQLDEANRKIKELEEVVEHRTKAHQLDSQLICLHDSRDEAMSSEQKLKDQLASLEAWVNLIENRDYVNYPWKPTVKEDMKNGEGPGNLSVPHLPPRRSTSSRELSEHAKETGDGVEDTIFSHPRLVTVIKGSTSVRGMALLDGWLYVVRLVSSQIEVIKARGAFKRSKKSIHLMPNGQQDKTGLFQRLKLRRKQKHISSGIQDIASCNRNKRLYLSDWQNKCVICVDPIRKEVIRSWSVESGEPWGISVNGEGNIIVSCSDSAQLCEYSAEGIFLRSIELLNADEGPWHGLTLWGADRWVVCHGGRYSDESFICVVDSDGNCVKGYEEICLNGASHLALLSSNHVLVAESMRNRIILLSPSLRGPPREILNLDFGISMPVRLHLCELSGRLAVGLADGTVLVYQIMNAADGQTNSAA